MKKSLVMLGLILVSKNYFSQKWVEMSTQPNANLYEIQKEFEKSFEGKDLSIKSTGYKIFKRWEYFVAPRVYPTGDLSVMNQATKNYADFLAQNNTNGVSSNKSTSSNSSVMSATWVAVGPIGAPTGSGKTIMS